MRRRSELLHEAAETSEASEGCLALSSKHALFAPSSPTAHAMGDDGLVVGNRVLQLQSLIANLEHGSAAEESANAKNSARTLKTRAVYYLSKREHSRAELAKKLSQPSYQARQKAFVHNSALPEPASAQAIEAVLDDLQRQGFLNDDRFAHSLAHKNASKHGAARVMATLKQHKLGAATTQLLADELKQTELGRCYEVWARRFEPVERAALDYAQAQAALGKQGRFLMQRGFSSDAVRKVLNGWQPE